MGQKDMDVSWAGTSQQGRHDVEGHAWFMVEKGVHGLTQGRQACF